MPQSSTDRRLGVLNLEAGCAIGAEQVTANSSPQVRDLRNRAVRHDAIPGTVGSRFGGLSGYPAEKKLFFLALAFA